MRVGGLRVVRPVIALAAVIAAATAVGAALERRFGEGADRAARRAMWLMLWVLLPVVAFFNIAALEITARVGAGIGFGYAALAAALAVAYALGTYVFRLSRASVGALMLASGFANTGYLGLPFSAALLGFDELPNAVAYDTLVSGLSFVTVGFVIGAGFGMVAERPRERVIAFVLRNPPLWASAAGLVAPRALAPEWAVDGSRLLVFLILPLGCFAVGVTLASVAGAGKRAFPPLTPPIAAALLVKLLLAPAIVLALSETVIGVPDAYLSQAAMASAINTIVVADQYELDRALVAAVIAWSTAIVVAAGLVIALV
ncbi:MAG: AEC family transporter [Solirubrobacteraceae bacterium]